MCRVQPAEGLLPRSDLILTKFEDLLRQHAEYNLGGGVIARRSRATGWLWAVYRGGWEIPHLIATQFERPRRDVVRFETLSEAVGYVVRVTDSGQLVEAIQRQNGTATGPPRGRPRKKAAAARD